MWKHHPRYGFRFSTTDGIVLVTTASITFFLASNIGQIGVLPAYVVGHFFLFCNVFRIRQIPELIWAGWFVSCCATAAFFAPFNVILVVILSLPLTCILIGNEIRHESYHGIFSKQEQRMP